MPAKKNPAAAAPEDSASEGNKARAAFEEYRKRMEAMAAGAPPGMGLYASQPVPPPMYPYGMPGWMPPPAAPAPFGMPPAPEAPAAGSGSLMQSLSALLRVGIEAVTAGLASGAQLVEGAWGPRAGAWGVMESAGPTCGCGSHGWPGPCRGHGGCHGGCHDCCSPHGMHHGCNPGVHNCR